jgi:hypothetical protein
MTPISGSTCSSDVRLATAAAAPSHPDLAAAAALAVAHEDRSAAVVEIVLAGRVTTQLAYRPGVGGRNIPGSIRRQRVRRIS